MSRHRHAEDGTALLEAFVLGLLLLAPLVWTLTVLSELHRGALAATAAAREAGFEAARSSDLSDAARAVDDAVARAMLDHGLDPRRARVAWSAPPGLARGGLVEVEVTYRVRVFAAPFLGRVAGPFVTVTATHIAPIDPYRSRE